MTNILAVIAVLYLLATLFYLTVSYVAGNHRKNYQNPALVLPMSACIIYLIWAAGANSLQLYKLLKGLMAGMSLLVLLSKRS